MSRKLASVQKVKAVRPIEGADKIELIQILNWDCVAKKSEFHEGDMVVYFEIDSLLPDIPMLEWLKGSSWSQKLNRYKISTHKFRDQISQGLIISLDQLKQFYDEVVEKNSGIVKTLVYPGCIETPREGDDLTEVLDIEKYEPVISCGDLGEIINHEWYVPKTDEERVQVCAEDVLPFYMSHDDWYASIKLDGCSCTAGLFDDAFLIGGRNQFFKGENRYTKTVNSYCNLEAQLKAYQQANGKYLVFQGELCGPGIQGNKLGLEKNRWFIFNVLESDTGKNGSYKKLDIHGMKLMCNYFGLETVPIIPEREKFDFKKTDDVNEMTKDLLNYVDKFKYRDYFEDASPKQQAAGVVFRMNDMTYSFKVVSNKYLLKGGE